MHKISGFYFYLKRIYSTRDFWDQQLTIVRVFFFRFLVSKNTFFAAFSLPYRDWQGLGLVFFYIIICINSDKSTLDFYGKKVLTKFLR
jgi:hypothetical protein